MEDEAEETGDSVWRGHILCGCVLTVSDVGSSPTWPCKATERRELSTGKNNSVALLSNQIYGFFLEYSNVQSCTFVDVFQVTERFWISYRFLLPWCFCVFLEPNFSPAEPDRAVGAAPGGKPSNHQPHKRLCHGAHRHRSCVSQRPPALQECQWFLGPTLWWPPHFPCCQAPGLPVCCRRPQSGRCSGESATSLSLR